MIGQERVNKKKINLRIMCSLLIFGKCAWQRADGSERPERDIFKR